MPRPLRPVSKTRLAPKRPAIPRVKRGAPPPKFFVRRRGSIAELEVTPYDIIPPGLVATLPEWQVYYWLTTQVGKEFAAGWEFQSSLMGGRLQLGGAVVDFLFRPPRWQPMAWRIQGDYFHFRSQHDQARDLYQRIRLIQAGFLVVDILGSDVLNKETRDRTLRAALGGIQLRPVEFLV